MELQAMGPAWAHGLLPVIGSTNGGVVPGEERMAEIGRRLRSVEAGRGWGEAVEGFRSDTLSDINSGLKALATGIQIISTILTMFGAGGSTDRNDNFEEAVGSSMDIGATILKVGLSKVMMALISPSPSTSSTSAVEKLGIAAPTATTASPQNLLHQQKVTAYVAKLTPAQIKLQQTLVQEHVASEAASQGLNTAQAALLLAQTLEHNGLPQVSSPLQSTIAGVAGGAGGVLAGLSSLLGGPVDKVGVPAPTSVEEDDTWVPGLPRPGTLEHTVTLALFKAQQGINSIMGKDDPLGAFMTKLTGGGQPVADQKVGLAAGAVVTDADDNSGGLLASVAALPQSVGSAAVQLLKFVTPPGTATGDSSAAGGDGVTYSEVQTGLNPTYAALGVLTTGALGSVLYSYAAQDSELASSATALAQGAVSLMRRNDIVSAASQALDGALDGASNALDGALAKMTGAKQPWGSQSFAYYDTGYDDHSYRDPLSDYADDYGLYDYTYATDQDQDQYQTKFGEEEGREELLTQESTNDFYADWPQTGFPGHEPATAGRPDTVVEATTPALDPASLPHAIPSNVQFYEPSLEPPSPSVPYVSYSEEHNPWMFLQTGESTDHLYRGFS